MQNACSNLNLISFQIINQKLDKTNKWHLVYEKERDMLLAAESLIVGLSSVLGVFNVLYFSMHTHCFFLQTGMTKHQNKK